MNITSNINSTKFRISNYTHTKKKLGSANFNYDEQLKTTLKYKLSTNGEKIKLQYTDEK